MNLEERVRVASEVVGRIAWVSPDFSNGGSIRADEPFIRIDPAEFELPVEAAAMAVREAEARVWVERAGADEDVRAFERRNPGVEPSESVRRLPSIAEAEARLMKAHADLKLAELHLERTNISLPYDGRVVASDVEVGELVGPADVVDGPPSRLGTVYRPEALQVAVPIVPRDLEYLDPVIGRTARVAGEMATWEARVARVFAMVAPKTRLAPLFLKLAEDAHPDSLPAPGTFVGGRHRRACATVLNDVRNAVDAIENFQPLNAERPEIELARLTIEAMTLAVSSSVVSEDELRLATENVRSELLELPSVSQVTLRGTRDREIAIELSEEELRRNDLSISQVSNAVQRASLNLTLRSASGTTGRSRPSTGCRRSPGTGWLARSWSSSCSCWCSTCVPRPG